MSVGGLLQSMPKEITIKRAYALIEKYNLSNLPQDKNLRDVIPNTDDFFLLTYFMNAQRKAKEIELKFLDLLGGVAVPASKGRGDGLVSGKYYELKTSTTNKDNKLNIRQIRPWQNVDYYLCSYIDELCVSKSKIYRLTKDEMHYEIDKIGGFTHGTNQANKNNKNIEYSITLPVYKDDHTDVSRWNERYWYNDLYESLSKKRP